MYKLPVSTNPHLEPLWPPGLDKHVGGKSHQPLKPGLLWPSGQNRRLPVDPWPSFGSVFAVDGQTKSGMEIGWSPTQQLSLLKIINEGCQVLGPRGGITQRCPQRLHPFYCFKSRAQLKIRDASPAS